MDFTPPLNTEELAELNSDIEFRSYREAIAPLYAEVLSASIKKDLKRILCGDSTKRSDSFMMITINPKPCTLIELQDPLKRMLKKKWIAESTYLYVIEQRKPPEFYKTINDSPDNGKHVHMIIKVKKRKSQVIREIANTFKKVCNVASIDVRTHNGEFWTDKMEYLTGVKTGEGKDIKQKGDVTFRLKNNIAVYYTNASTTTKKESKEESDRPTQETGATRLPCNVFVQT